MPHVNIDMACDTHAKYIVNAMQSSGLVRHIFRLLEQAIRDQHPIPWVLLENVSIAGGDLLWEL